MVVKRGLIVGIALFIVGFGLNFVCSALFPSIKVEYENAAIFRPFSDPLMLLFFAYPLLLGMTLSYFWSLVKDRLKGKTRMEKALSFANANFIISTIPGMFVSYSSFQISFLMILVWTMTGYLEAFIAGWMFTKEK